MASPRSNLQNPEPITQCTSRQQIDEKFT
ncbi:uncharacterized protein G2W53_008523 [Senna tora]|uniref:Uncharacterized protein n=1 Tax=Senna tora TaxID=362788 RepID=A0A835CEP7_9FABA|nr:uncharacterized protein G2W53_008523 [Senna tora]